MDSPGKTDSFEQLWRSFKFFLQQLSVTPCGLQHEVVQTESGSDLPQKRDIGNGPEYQRPSICSAKRRNHMGCAHTTYRSIIVHRAEQFCQHFPAGAAMTRKFIEALNATEQKLNQTDRDKSEGELRMARLKESFYRTPAPETTSAINTQQQYLNTIAKQHQLINQEFFDLKECYLQELDKLIKKHVDCCDQVAEQQS